MATSGDFGMQLPFWHPEVLDQSEVAPATQEQLTALRDLLVEAADTLDDLIKKDRISIVEDDYIRQDEHVKVSAGRQIGTHPVRFYLAYNQRPLSLTSAHTIYRLCDDGHTLGLIKEDGSILDATPVLDLGTLDDDRPETIRAALFNGLDESAERIRTEHEMHELVPGFAAVSTDECQAVIDDVSASWAIRKVELGLI